MAWPGQALAYQSGELKIRELGVLEESVEEWIAQQRVKPPRQAQHMAK